ncbi:MAG: SdpI family protein [Saprospirales bacterium]|nr:MAG: SdpI family protein [Saprospirales bacterium]
MDLLNPLLITLVPTGLIFAFAGWILQKKPPKGINSTYGYRTSRSMKNPENWKFAQEYSAKEMMRIGWTLTLVGILGGILQVSDAVGIVFSVVLIVGSAIWIIYKTEKKLKENGLSHKDTE